MSVRFNDDRGKWEVRWREGGRQPSRLFDRKGDADAFDLETRRRRQLGPLAPSMVRSTQTLAEFMQGDYWPRYAIPNLAEDTRRRYLEVWGTHLLDRLGGYPLREITPELVEDVLAQMRRARVGAPTQRKALMLLQGIMRRAVVRGLIPVNPVQMVDKPRQAPGQLPRPLPPIVVEQIRARMLLAWSSEKRGSGRSVEQLAWWRQRNVTMLSLLAYAGVRPVEDRGARWDDVRGRTLHVLATKTGRARDVDLLAPLAQDLAAWRLLCGRPPGRALIFPTLDGDEWTRDDWNNWRRRVYRPAATAAGVTGDLRPYRLRGSFASLLLWEGRSLTYVAEQTGHSVATLARYYAGTLRELEHARRVPAEQAIRDARERIARGERPNLEAADG
jgi:integrase